MIWHLLWLYPLFGLGLGIYYAPRWRKYKVAGGLGWLLSLMIFGWPLFWSSARADIAANREAIETHEDWKYQELLERVRAERHAPDPRLAEFDILLGIEPEPKQFSWEDTINDSWEMPEYRVRHVQPSNWFYETKPPTTAELTFKDGGNFRL